jgi:hypothetical protein
MAQVRASTGFQSLHPDIDPQESVSYQPQPGPEPAPEPENAPQPQEKKLVTSQKRS